MRLMSGLQRQAVPGGAVAVRGATGGETTTSQHAVSDARVRGATAAAVAHEPDANDYAMAGAAYACRSDACSHVLINACSHERIQVQYWHPPDLSAIVSLRFTFGITLTEQSFFKPTKTYQVNSIVTSHGRQPSVHQLLAAQPAVASNPAAPSAPSCAPSAGASPSAPAGASAVSDADDVTDDILDSTNKMRFSDTPVSIGGSTTQRELFREKIPRAYHLATDPAKFSAAASHGTSIQHVSKRSQKAPAPESASTEMKAGHSKRDK
ncbi:hypothetical protein ACP4OV_001447 [Aristida adscensionis]